MTKKEQIEEMAKLLWNSPVKCPYDFAECPFGLHKKFTCNCCNMATALYDAGYRKTFTSDLASDTQKAFKEGYIKGSIDCMLLERKETAKEIFTKLIEVAKNNDNKLSIGLLKAWAIEYGVEIKEYGYESIV